MFFEYRRYWKVLEVDEVWLVPLRVNQAFTGIANVTFILSK
jgi:hypothetical protein